MLRKLADRLGIKQLREFDDVVPLFFAHTAFKSYPASLLDKKRFDLMTKWLDTLTSHDLSHVDVAGCESIDEWIERLDAQTPLEVITSSGTTGTISIIPKEKAGAIQGMELWKMFLFQRFGKEPTPEELDPQVDVIWPNYAKGKLGHLRIAEMLKRSFTGGDESRFHALYSEEVSADLMFLASKLRRAASRGELDRVQVDPKLLARKSEFEAMEARRPQEMAAFFERCTQQLAGKRVFMTGAYHLMYELAVEGLAARREERVCQGLRDPDRWRSQGLRAPGWLHGRDPGVPRRRPDPGGLRHVRDQRLPLGLRREALSRAAVGDPVPARPRHERAAAARGRAHRPRGVLRLPEQQPLGRHHLGRRDHDRLEHAVPLRARERAHRARDHALQREAGRRGRPDQLLGHRRGQERGAPLHAGIEG